MKRQVSFGTQLTVISLAVLALLAAWSVFRCQVAFSRASASKQLLIECQRACNDIHDLRGGPERAALQGRSPTELTRNIQISAERADIESQHILQIEPRPPRRLDDSAYVEQPTHVDLRPVTVRQLVSWIYDLVADDPALDVTTLRLSALREQEVDSNDREAWLAEVTLTYLIYAPKTPRSR